VAQSMDSEGFLRRCRECGAETHLLDGIDGKSAAEWWRETNSGDLMKWVLDKIGPQLTVEQREAIASDPYVKIHSKELDESLASNLIARNEADKGSERLKNRHDLIVNYKWALANATREVVGNPFEA